MRQIKFRLWDGHKMTSNPSYIVDRKIIPILAEAEQPVFLDINTIIQKFIKDGNILMQFTGLQDKTGKDIYEGDILSYMAKPEGFPEDKEKFHKVIIEWTSMNNHTFLFGHHEYEIIGNIYQNEINP